jgi:hypothetical protein
MGRARSRTSIYEHTPSTSKSALTIVLPHDQCAGRGVAATAVLVATPLPGPLPQGKRERSEYVATKMLQTARRANQLKSRQALSLKIFRFRRRANQCFDSARLTANEGRSRSSRTCGEMRWTRELRLTSVARRVRRNRVVLTPDAGVQLRGRIRAATVAKEPASPGRARSKP